MYQAKQKQNPAVYRSLEQHLSDVFDIFFVETEGNFGLCRPPLYTGKNIR